MLLLANQLIMPLHSQIFFESLLYLPDALLGTCNEVRNKTDEVPLTQGLHFSRMRQTTHKHICQEVVSAR